MKRKIALALGASIIALLVGLIAAIQFFRSPISGDAIVETEMYGTVSGIRHLPDGVYAIVSEDSGAEGIAVMLDAHVVTSGIVSGRKYRISYEQSLKTGKILVTAIEPAQPFR